MKQQCLLGGWGLHMVGAVARSVDRTPMHMVVGLCSICQLTLTCTTTVVTFGLCMHDHLDCHCLYLVISCS